MATWLVDTDVLVDHLRGHREARDFLAGRIEAGERLCCSVITTAELHAGLRTGEERVLRALLSCLEQLPVDRGVAEAAGEYRRQYGPSHGVLLPDAIIAATARAERATLVTSNRRHFPMGDLCVVTPEES